MNCISSQHDCSVSLKKDGGEAVIRTFLFQSQNSDQLHVVSPVCILIPVSGQ